METSAGIGHVPEASPEKEEEALPGQQTHTFGFEVSSERNQVVDWLHRGRREPLASMGMYVYSMYVYSAHLDPDAYTDNDFAVYRFADTHPSAGKRVQKLRIDEMFK
eukprot:8961851-Karenia_brevis.AAC.1